MKIDTSFCNAAHTHTRIREKGSFSNRTQKETREFHTRSHNTYVDLSYTIVREQNIEKKFKKSNFEKI